MWTCPKCYGHDDGTGKCDCCRSEVWVIPEHWVTPPVSKMLVIDRKIESDIQHAVEQAQTAYYERQSLVTFKE